MSAEIIQFIPRARSPREIERQAIAIVDEIFRFAGASEQSHYHNPPIIDTAPSEMPPESA